MAVVSTAKYLGMSPKKARALAESIKKMKPSVALSSLLMAREKDARLFSKAIKGAIADATNNFKLNENSLVFSSIQVGKGPFSKRWQPVARGMAHSIKKRTTHVKIILEEAKKPALPPAPKLLTNKNIKNDKKEKTGK